MSIILKALKKAEESKSIRETAVQKHTYQIGDRKALIIIIAGFIGLVLFFFAGIYWFKGRPSSKPAAKHSGAPIVQPEELIGSAEKEAQAVIANDLDIEVLLEDAIRQIKEKNYLNAEGILRKALTAAPDDAELNNHLGLALKNQGKLEEAVSSYQRAIHLKPDYVEAMNNLAVTEEMLGNREKAKSLYKKALSIKSSYAEAHLNSALLFEAEGNTGEAENHYDKFLNLSRDEFLKKRVKERLAGLRK